MKSFIIGCVFVLCFIFSLEVYAGNNCEPNGKMNASGTCDCSKGFKSVGVAGKSRCEKEVVKASEDADKPDPIDKVKLDRERDWRIVRAEIINREHDFEECLIGDDNYKPDCAPGWGTRKECTPYDTFVYINVDIKIKYNDETEHNDVTVSFGDSNYKSINGDVSNLSNFSACIYRVYSTVIFPPIKDYTDSFRHDIMTHAEIVKEKNRRIAAAKELEAIKAKEEEKRKEEAIMEEKIRIQILERERQRLKREEEDSKLNKLVDESGVLEVRRLIGELTNLIRDGYTITLHVQEDKGFQTYRYRKATGTMNDAFSGTILK